MMIRSSFDEGATWQSQTDGTRITTKRAAYSDMKIINDDEIGLVYEGGELGDAGAANDAIRFAYFPESDLGLPDDYSGGTSTPDKSGLDNSAILRGTGGSLSSDGGRWGGAISLDGSSSYVQVPFAESLAVGTGDFTFSTWINYGRSSTAEQAILWAYGQGDNHSQLWVRALPGDDRIRAWLQNRGTSAILDSPSAYADQQWHHLVVRRSGSEGTMFVDGAQVNSTSIEFGTVSPGRPFQLHIGQRLDGQNRFHGSIDETRLYRRALSDEEIGSLYDTNANIDDELVLQLAFDRTG
ncbi:concanavalin A-like lectin/glucanase domain-containing protein [Aspergillus lucknowensis]|uniref:Concanavalin A-like lectin/glucanase domain-containing protein n=1 Tax=Aspergillus lucknowensis TaxID=176173 RepID=A0ABR4LJT7_9EURO